MLVNVRNLLRLMWVRFCRRFGDFVMFYFIFRVGLWGFVWYGVGGFWLVVWCRCWFSYVLELEGVLVVCW